MSNGAETADKMSKYFEALEKLEKDFEAATEQILDKDYITEQDLNDCLATLLVNINQRLKVLKLAVFKHYLSEASKPKLLIDE